MLPTDSAMGKQGSVLVVDDDLAVLDVIADVLELAGYEVDTAEHGGEALEKLRLSLPGVVLLDLMMPVMSGEEFLRECRRSGQRAAFPVVVLTAAMAPSEDPAASLDVEAFIAKPFDIDVLVATVRRFMPG
jgi:CheY-like chemotaxis protein